MVIAFTQAHPSGGRAAAGRAAGVASHKLRLFLALWPDAEIRAALADAGKPFATLGRNIAPANLHLTLAFLGAAPADAVPRLIGLMRAAHPRPVTLELDRLGYFAGSRALWLGAEHASPALMHYQQRLTQGLRQAGFRTEDRPFRPHVTLLRDCARPALADLPHPQLRWQAREFAVVVSTPEPGGVRYRVLDSIRA